MIQRYATENKRFFYMRGSDDIREYLKCQQSLIYFIENYVYIVSEGRGKVKFQLYPYQTALLKIWMQNRFTVALKPRQMGITVLVCAYILWLCMFHRHKMVTVLSIKAALGRAMLRRIKFMYENLPDFLKLEVINGTGTDVGTADRIAWSNGSEATSQAATPDAARSEALSLLVMDEVSFQRHASSIWAAAYPTLSTGGNAILFSTPFGTSNLFYEIYSQAVQGVNGFYPVRLDWKLHPERDDNWYAQQVLNLGRRRVAQEVDCDFLQSGFNVFDMGKIRSLEDKLKYIHPIEERIGQQLKIYYRPDPNKQYYIGADVASGRARDYSAFSVMDNTGLEVACFKGKMGVRDFGYLLAKTGMEYNQAVLAPESNSIGEGVIATLQENHYPNLYAHVSQTMRLGMNDYDQSDIVGWLTTGKTRHAIITGMDDDLNSDTIELNNPFFVQEAYTFIYSATNKPIAAGKGGSEYDEGGVNNDDSILAACIANEVRKHPAKYKSEMPFLFV